MNKQEILNEIEKAKEHLANMKNMLKVCESERWKPEEREEYWYLDFGLNIHTVKNFNYPSDIKAINVYNCFETEEEAKQEAENILIRRQLENIARRLNKNEKIDWNNFAQDKYFLGIDYNKYLAMGVGLSCCNNIRTQGTVYCLNRNFKDVAIQEIGEERLKKYLRGE
jgi:hypothetical protein|nr:MAG TPA_asm: hypothetical protein [Caudoviricetes sp.]